MELSSSYNRRIDCGLIWSLSNIPPRAKVFLWHLVSDYLPLLSKVNQVMSYVDSLCPLRHRTKETALHLFYCCDFARAVWFASLLGLRSLQQNQDFYGWKKIVCKQSMKFLEIFSLTFPLRNKRFWMSKSNMKKIRLVLICPFLMRQGTDWGSFFYKKKYTGGRNQESNGCRKVIIIQNSFMLWCNIVRRNYLLPLYQMILVILSLLLKT